MKLEHPAEPVPRLLGATEQCAGHRPGADTRAPTRLLEQSPIYPFDGTDARSEAVRDRIGAQVAKLKPDSERDALFWIEAVSEFDANEPR